MEPALEANWCGGDQRTVCASGYAIKPSSGIDLEWVVICNREDWCMFLEVPSGAAVNLCQGQQGSVDNIVNF